MSDDEWRGIVPVRLPAMPGLGVLINVVLGLGIVAFLVGVALAAVPPVPGTLAGSTLIVAGIALNILDRGMRETA